MGWFYQETLFCRVTHAYSTYNVLLVFFLIVSIWQHQKVLPGANKHFPHGIALRFYLLYM